MGWGERVGQEQLHWDFVPSELGGEELRVHCWDLEIFSVGFGLWIF